MFWKFANGLKIKVKKFRDFLKKKKIQKNKINLLKFCIIILGTKTELFL